MKKNKVLNSSHQKVNFSLPKSIKYKFVELSYAKNEVDFKNHLLSLGKQIFCNEIFTFLNKENDISSFVLSVNKTKIDSFSLKNEYRPIVKINYNFDIKEIVFVDTNNNLPENYTTKVIEFSLVCLNLLSSFENYVGMSDQEDVLWWVYKTAKDNKVFTKIKDGDFGFEFLINKDFIDILIRDAYGDEFPRFLSDFLNDQLPINVQKSKTIKL